MGEQWRVSVREDACVGSSFCADLAPGSFVVEKGRSRVLDAAVEANEDLRDAAEACPVLAVVIRDAATGDQIAPVG